MGKNVAVFVDVANIFYAAKAAGVDIDYVTLLKSATAGRDLVRAYAYTGLDPDNENQRNFHDFLRRSNYKVVSKDIRKYGDGKVKANLDIELVVDMMKTARNLDIAIIVSGDGDFAPAIRAVQEQGVRVEVISFRGNTSSDLIEAADQFTDIVQLARVEKGSRSGRRVADDGDLSMTEVPDKQTEGTGVGRGRGSRGGRGRGRSEAAPATSARDRDRGRGRGRSTTRDESGAVVALPGERLSRAGGLTEADLAAAEVFTLDDLDQPMDDEAREAAADRVGADDEGEDSQRRRRRRRGGRGRGRGRGREDGTSGEDQDGRPRDADAEALEDAIAAGAVPGADADVDEEEDEEAPRVAASAAPRAPRANPFGSVWDSQLGTNAAPANLGPIAADDEDFDEPEIPEYLIAEQRRGAAGGRGGRGGQGRGPRGGRSAYQSAMDRERFGGRAGGGINRYPDVSGRTGVPAGGPGAGRGSAPRDARPAPRRDRDDRPRERTRDAEARSSSSEPWSEVPPELEAMLRAQVGAGVPRPALAPEAAPETAVEVTEEAPTPKRRATRVKAVPEAAEVAEVTDQAPTPKRRATRVKAAPEATEAAPESAEATDAAPAPKRRATRTTGAKAEAAPEAAPETAEATAATPAPKRRATRTTRARAEAGSSEADAT
ncbi:MAG: NYN domain-containing protein [Candidatus Limnocylindria bacterium]